MSSSQSFAPVAILGQSLEEAFPVVDPNYKPFGSRVLVQIRSPHHKTKSGIVLAQETKENIQGNTQVAKVISIGPLAYCNRNTGERWPEGAWAQGGEFVRVPKYGGDTFEVKIDQSEVAIFRVFNDLDISGSIPDPLSVIAYV